MCKHFFTAPDGTVVVGKGKTKSAAKRDAMRKARK
jgi:hypothetical protein